MCDFRVGCESKGKTHIVKIIYMKLKSLKPNLMVEDINQTLNYYHGVLSFDTIAKGPEGAVNLHWAHVRKGEVEIMFQLEEHLKRELPELRKEDIGGGLTLYIEMEGVDKYYEYLYTSSDVVDQIKDTADGMREFTVRDVNGYYLTFAERIK